MKYTLTAILLAMALHGVAIAADPNLPHVGYLLPGGGQRGTTVQVLIGGQKLGSAKAVLVSGTGIRGKVVKYYRPIITNNKYVREFRARIRDRQLQLAGKKLKVNPKKKEERIALPDETHPLAVALKTLSAAALRDLQVRLFDPIRKLQTKRAIADELLISLTIDRNAAPGPREIRILTKVGLSKPIRFFVGTVRDHVEPLWYTYKPSQPKALTLPVNIHGQLLPKQTDRYSFKARKGQPLVIQTRARELIPFMSDSVPGWFQPVITLKDAAGTELAYGDDFRFNPDPTITFTPPADGEYYLEIRDSIYRGREDFIYMITISRAPLVTSMFPLGMRSGTQAKIKLTGYNLTQTTTLLRGKPVAPGTTPKIYKQPLHGTSMLYSVDTPPEVLESNVNNTISASQKLALPQTVNGRIESPGDVDVFCFQAKAGQTIVAEILARRLNSPLDSMLHLMDAKGKILACNDDNPDTMNIGLQTHHADSYVRLKIPRDGRYYLRVSDTRGEGSPAHGYRLRLSHARPDFDVYMEPSSLTFTPGQTQSVTVHIDRKDGFTGAVDVNFAKEVNGATLSGNTIPAGAKSVQMTITAPNHPVQKRDKKGKKLPLPKTSFGIPKAIAFSATATAGVKTLTRRVIPADDITQAFVIHHLVPAEQCIALVTNSRRRMQRFLPANVKPVRLVPGKTTMMPLAPPSWILTSKTHQVSFSLVNPPKGVALKKVVIKDGKMLLPIIVDPKSDAAKGFRGNLILDAFQARKPGVDPKSKKPINTRAYPVGTQPAVPCEIVAVKPAK